jgi:hypothetical protein
MSEDHGHASSPAASAAADPDAGEVTGPAFAVPEDAVVRRTRDGWRVGGEEVPDLTCAMVLADLLAAELPADGQGPQGVPAREQGTPELASAPPAPLAAADGSPAASGPALDGQAARSAAGSAATSQPEAAASGVPAGETAVTPTPVTSGSGAETASAVASEAHRLKATVSQLQYALTARIRVEQAIGVLAERHRIQPRQAFEQLRAAARSRGQKVIDIATDVVASATNPLLQLPDELSRPRSGGRRGAHQPRGAH